jgi:hypothetical protein
MENNNNHNGKEVNRDQTLRNGQKGASARPVDKIKKNNITGEKEIRPAEPKKISLNNNRNQGNQRKSSPKGQVIKLSDKENKIQTVETPVKENRPAYTKPASANNLRTPLAETPVVNKDSNNEKSHSPDKGSYSISDKTGLWLLMAAVLFLIAWAVVYLHYHIGGNSHMLLAFAVICAVISLAGKRKK